MHHHILLAAFLLFTGTSAAWAQPTGSKVTVDDLMKLRSISDVRISPNGRTVAYVVSVPSLDKALHVASLYVIPSEGGTPRQLANETEIFSRPLPAPHLRWSPDGKMLAF